MNDNHNHALEEVLAGTVPQARPEFQEVLEEQLMLTMQERLEMKPMNNHDDRESKPKRIPRGFSVSLAATFAMILFGGLAAFIASGQLAKAPMFTGAAQNQQDTIPQDMAATATAIILQATYQAAEAQFLTANAQLEALAQQATEQAAASNPDQAMTSIVQTATAVVQQATERASGILFPTVVDPAAQTATAVIQRATEEAAVLWTATAQAEFVPSLVPSNTPLDSVFATVVPQTCPPEKLVVYTAPGTHNPVLTSIDPLTAEKYQVQGMLTLNETGEDWFYVTFAHEGEQAFGWVQANVIRAACESLTSSVITGDSQITLLPPTVVPPVSEQIFTSTPIPPTVVPPAYTATPTAWDAPPMYTATPIPWDGQSTYTMTPSFTFTPSPAGPLSSSPTPTPVPLLGSGRTVQVRVADPEMLDLNALIGRQVDIYIAVGSEDAPIIVPVARGATVQEFVEVPMPNEDRYVFIEAIIIPRTVEQAELLYGLSQTHMEMKFVPVD